MSVLKKKSSFKDISIPKDEVCEDKFFEIPEYDPSKNKYEISNFEPQGKYEISNFEPQGKYEISNFEPQGKYEISNFEPQGRGRPKKQIFDKRNCTYTFYCTEKELQSIKAKAKEKHLTLAEYFRMRLLLD